MRSLTTLLALTAAATGAVLKKDMPTAIHVNLDEIDIATMNHFPIAARQEPYTRYVEMYSSNSDDCLGDRFPLPFTGGKYGEPEQRFCQDFDSQSVRSFSIQSQAGCRVFIQQGSCDKGGRPVKQVDRYGACTQAFLDEPAPTAQSLVIRCYAGAAPATGDDLQVDTDIAARQEPYARHVDIYSAGSDDCSVNKSPLPFTGGVYGEPEQRHCHDFDIQSVRSFSIYSQAGCGVWIQEGSCQTGGRQKLVDQNGACTPAFLEQGAPNVQSLLVLCNAGAGNLGIPPTVREAHSTALTKRGERAISVPRADQRWVKYWLTNNDQCQVRPEDSGTIYSGNMGENFSEECQTRDAVGDSTWIEVSDSHGCDLYIQVGSCDAMSGFPLRIEQGQCTHVPQDGGSEWSLRAVCSG
ncbi:hypothetical protein PRZ48_005925 [Zasmidium cellare]|uniref:Uncharacterized protein n=1 Tax=Zasmidium cellare TaxID=395010 RepID=A0ABR0EMV0_ZASCE|nr:hypothetical protein PRZ48_005925 [Zasmidium cellare]